MFCISQEDKYGKYDDKYGKVSLLVARAWVTLWCTSGLVSHCTSVCRTQPSEIHMCSFA